MRSRKLPVSDLARFLPVAIAASLLAGASPVEAQRRAVVKLTEETLVPTEVFATDDGKRLGYPDGFDALYTRTEKGHEWKLTEAAPPPPTPDPEATPTPTPEPTPPGLGPTADESDFIQRSGLVRPSFVTLQFTDSPETAARMVADFQAAYADEAARPQNLVVYALDKDAKVAANAVVYSREFNLGAKAGGLRMASTVVTSKGNVFVRVDAALGLKDGDFEANMDRLHERAQAIAIYLLRKL